jgi:hypothetical protein
VRVKVSAGKYGGDSDWGWDCELLRQFEHLLAMATMCRLDWGGGGGAVRASSRIQEEMGGGQVVGGGQVQKVEDEDEGRERERSGDRSVHLMQHRGVGGRD